MADVILTRRNGTDGHLFMTPSVLEKILKLLLHPNRYLATLHVQSESFPQEFILPIEAAFERGARLRLAFDIGLAKTKIPKLEKKVPILICLSGTEEAESCDGWESLDQFDVYIAFSTHHVNGERLQKLMKEMGRKVRNVILAPGRAHAASAVGVNFFDDAQVWAEAIVDLVMRLGALCNRVLVACGLPLCIFNDGQLARLAASRLAWPIASCNMPLCIEPGGEVLPCASLPAMPEMGLESLLSLQTARQFVQTRYAAFRGVCLHAEGFTCRSLGLACRSGCVATGINEWRSVETAVRKVRE